MKCKPYPAKSFVLYLYLVVVLSAYSFKLNAQELPIGYKAYYQQTGNSQNFLNTLTFNPLAAWSISNDKRYTRLNSLETDSANPAAIPQSRGIIADQIYGEFIMEFEFRLPQTPNGDSSGFYLLAPTKNCDTYYAFCFNADSVYFSYINKGATQKLGTKAFKTSINQWQNIRVERDILTRTLSIVSVKTKQQISFTNRRLVMGYIGFGTQNVNSHLRNIRIWAPTTISETKLNCE